MQVPALSIATSDTHALPAFIEQLEGVIDRTEALEPVLNELGKWARREVKQNFIAGGRPDPWAPLAMAVQAVLAQQEYTEVTIDDNVQIEHAGQETSITITEGKDLTEGKFVSEFSLAWCCFWLRQVALAQLA